MKHPARLTAVVLILSLSGSSLGYAATKIQPVDWRRLSDRDISPQGKAALQIQPKQWQHAETEHFVHHFTDDRKAETVYVHAEVYYRWIKNLFGVTRDEWSKKAQIFTFSDQEA